MLIISDSDTISLHPVITPTGTIIVCRTTDRDIAQNDKGWRVVRVNEFENLAQLGRYSTKEEAVEVGLEITRNLVHTTESARIDELERRLSDRDTRLDALNKHIANWERTAQELVKRIRSKRQVVFSDDPPPVRRSQLDELQRECEILEEGHAWEPIFSQITDWVYKAYCQNSSEAYRYKILLDSIWDQYQEELAKRGEISTLWDHLND